MKSIEQEFDRKLSNRVSRFAQCPSRKTEKNVAREVTFINPRLLSTWRHMLLVSWIEIVQVTALRKIISISVRILLFSTFYNYSCFMLYTRARYERGPIIDRLNLLLCSSETIKSRRVFRNRKIVQLSDVLIRPRFCLLDESLGEKLYDCRTTVRQRET